MIKPQYFYEALVENGIDFFTGVPDSLLKEICAYITDNVSKRNHIISANEGNSIALASGYNLATNKIPLVYMQNSGIGNAINPLLSLADEEVYSIPMLLMIGWRGRPGVKDEPQHVKQGKVTLSLLETMGIEYVVLPKNLKEVNYVIKELILKISKTNKPHALVIEKDTFSKYSAKNKIEDYSDFTREDALKLIIDALQNDDVVVSTTGKLSRELYEYRVHKGQSNQSDFLTVGSMGHTSQIALGIALKKEDKNIYCLDGDGSVLMHTGGMGIVGDMKPRNFYHIIFNNGTHESVGGQPTIGKTISFEKIAQGFNYKHTNSVSNKEELINVLQKLKKLDGPLLIEIKVKSSSRKDLGRPTKSPAENKSLFMDFLND